MLVLDKVSKQTSDIVIRFSALFHDIGKSITPKELLPKHYEHDKNGATILNNMDKRYGKEFLKTVSFVAKNHMAVMHMTKKEK